MAAQPDQGDAVANRAIRGRSIGAQLNFMVLACLVPAILFGATWLYSAYSERRAMVESDLLNTTRALSLAVDRELYTLRAALLVLANSRELRDDDFAAFYELADSTMRHFPDSHIVLADRTGQEVVQTLVPWGMPLPRRNTSVAQVFETGKPVISDLVVGAVSKQAGVSVDVPVFRNGKPVYSLAMVLPATHFTEMLRQLRLPPEWTPSIADRNHVIIARPRNPEQFVGQRSRSRDTISSATPESVVSMTTFEGESAIGAIVRSSMSGWSILIQVPLLAITADIWRWFWAEAACIAILAVFSLTVARSIGARITRSVRALIAPATALGNGAPVEIATPEIAEMQEVARALTHASTLLEQHAAERNAAEAALRESARTIEAILAAAPLGTITVNADGVITRWNKAAETISGYTAEEMVGRAYGQTLEPLDTQMPPTEVMARVRSGEVVLGVRSRRRRRDGKTFDLVSGISPLFEPDGKFAGAFMIGQDVTELLHAEEQLRQSQKMDAIGKLTGGIAHDFNNIIGAAVLNLEMQAVEIQGNELATELNNDVMASLLRGAELTRSLLTFARKQPLESVRASLNELTAEIVGLLARTLGEAIQIDLQLSNATGEVYVDKAQYQTAIANLATNARDAMPTGGGLLIATGSVAFAPEDQRPDDLPPGTYAVVTVQDTGTGMPRDVAERVFEPFFTTKPVGKGTGLGLSMVFGFAKQAGGHVELDSKPGQGTTVRLYLPRITSSREPTAHRAQVDAASSGGGGQCVLVVEDDESLRTSTLRHLALLGYRTISASDGHKALAILESDQRIDVVLSDVVMPGGISGSDLARIVREKWPSTRIVLTSGFPDVQAGMVLPPGVALLPKPYRQEHLERTLRAAFAA